jgi:hypothetical protein
LGPILGLRASGFRESAAPPWGGAVEVNLRGFWRFLARPSIPFRLEAVKEEERLSRPFGLPKRLRG